MDLQFLYEVFNSHSNEPALTTGKTAFSYSDLLSAISEWRSWFKQQDVLESTRVITLEADFSLHSVALLLVLIENNRVIVPLTESVETLKPELRATAMAEAQIILGTEGTANAIRLPHSAKHSLYDVLFEKSHPGLVLFSSGSTGVRKAVVHDFSNLLEKFRVRRQCKRTITFFLFDHIGGLDTLLHTLSNGGCVITVQNRNPDEVCSLVEHHAVEVLPVSPTFINLLLISGAQERYDLSSLQIVTYGTEVMPPDTLARLCEALPWVKTQQKYGLSELGALRSKSESNDSIWVKLGGENIEIRVSDGKLEIKSPSTMLGYLNAEAPFTEDGWFKTGDAVEQKGEYFRILGRQSEQINIGGEKFYPAEVEAVLMKLEGVSDVAITSRSNPITGSMLVATFTLTQEEPIPDFRARVRAFCQDRLPTYMTPQKIVVSKNELHGDRFKKMRN